MKRATIFSFWAVLGLGLGGCQGAMWGNIAVFAVSVGIFMGTLSLGRSSR